MDRLGPFESSGKKIFRNSSRTVRGREITAARATSMPASCTVSDRCRLSKGVSKRMLHREMCAVWELFEWKIVMKMLVASAVSVIVLSGFVSGVRAKDVPLKGDYAGQAIRAEPTADPATLFITTAGTGHLTHLGEFTFLSPHLAGLADLSVVGEQILTAANGDTITGTFHSFLHPLDSTFQFLGGDIEVTIDGGTGRFANATGSYIFSITFETATLKSVATFSGAIDYAGK